MRGEGEATRKIRKLVKIAEVRALRQTAGSDRCGNTKKKPETLSEVHACLYFCAVRVVQHGESKSEFVPSLPSCEQR